MLAVCNQLFQSGSNLLIHETASSKMDSRYSKPIFNILYLDHEPAARINIVKS